MTEILAYLVQKPPDAPAGARQRKCPAGFGPSRKPCCASRYFFFRGRSRLWKSNPDPKKDAPPDRPKHDPETPSHDPATTQPPPSHTPNTPHTHPTHTPNTPQTHPNTQEPRPKQQAREPQQNVRFSFGPQNFPPFVDNSIALRQSGPFRHPSQKGVQGLNRDLAPRGAGAVACR